MTHMCYSPNEVKRYTWKSFCDRSILRGMMLTNKLDIWQEVDSLTRHVAQATRPQRGRLLCMRLERQPIVFNVNYGGLSLLGPDWSITRSHHFGKTQVGLPNNSFAAENCKHLTPSAKQNQPFLISPGEFKRRAPGEDEAGHVKCRRCCRGWRLYWVDCLCFLNLNEKSYTKFLTN